jgi:hypothetical protein
VTVDRDLSGANCTKLPGGTTEFNFDLPSGDNLGKTVTVTCGVGSGGGGGGL